jgi:hypothetical protein
VWSDVSVGTRFTWIRDLQKSKEHRLKSVLPKTNAPLGTACRAPTEYGGGGALDYERHADGAWRFGEDFDDEGLPAILH